MATVAPEESTDSCTLVDGSEVWPPRALHSVPTIGVCQDIGQESDRLDLMSQKVKRC